MKRAIVIIPTFNERENIAKAIPWLQSVYQKIDNWKMETLVVDDSSPDKTAEVVQKLQKKYSNLHLLLNKQKSGLGGAYLKGMDAAFYKHKADIVFQFDADLSHDATKIPAFLKRIEEGADLVLGSRYIPGGAIPSNWGWHRKFLSVVGNWIIVFAFGNFTIRDWTTGFRALTKAVYDAVSDELHDARFSGYTFQIGFLHKAIRKGFKVSEVPFKFVDRTSGQSKMGPEYIKNILMFIFKVRLQELLKNRIFKFVMVGGTGAVVQLVALSVLRQFLPYQLAFFLGIECAVISNFILNNIWTFADRKLKTSQIPRSFITFNLASAGSIIIQQIVAALGEFLIGFPVLFTVPILNKQIDAGLFYAVAGILIGMFWNFFAYNKFVWIKKTK